MNEQKCNVSQMDVLVTRSIATPEVTRADRIFNCLCSSIHRSLSLSLSLALSLSLSFSLSQTHALSFSVSGARVRAHTHTHTRHATFLVSASVWFSPGVAGRPRRGRSGWMRWVWRRCEADGCLVGVKPNVPCGRGPGALRLAL